MEQRPKNLSCYSTWVRSQHNSWGSKRVTVVTVAAAVWKVQRQKEHSLFKLLCNSLSFFFNCLLSLLLNLTRGEACGIPFKATNSHTWTGTKFRLAFDVVCLSSYNIVSHWELVDPQQCMRQFVLLQVSQVRNPRSSNAVSSALQFSRRRPLNHI